MKRQCDAEKESFTVTLLPGIGDSTLPQWSVLRAMLVFTCGDYILRQQQCISSARSNSDSASLHHMNEPPHSQFVFDDRIFKAQERRVPVLVWAEVATALHQEHMQHSSEAKNVVVPCQPSPASIVRGVANSPAVQKRSFLASVNMGQLWELKPSRLALQRSTFPDSTCDDIVTTFLVVNGSEEPLPFQIKASPHLVVHPKCGIVPAEVRFCELSSPNHGTILKIDFLSLS